MNQAADSSTPSSGRLLGLLTAGFYILFTLLPDSHSLMVAWPWVFLWQVALLCPMLWLLGQIWVTQRLPRLGSGLDWLMGWIGLSLIVSAVFAPLPAQARWYGWAALGFLAALSVLSDRLPRPEQRQSLLVKQGYLSLAFIAVSLLLWLTQTLLPELGRLRQLRQFGFEASFDFSVLELRNWAPLGHQNYVAGYLLLALPLLIGLAIVQKGSLRWLWIVGTGLGLVDLYTTSSRGGWLGFVVFCVAGAGFLLYRSALPRRWVLSGSAGVFVLLVVLIAANNRLRTVIAAILRGEAGGELAFRIITTVAGWRMGAAHPISGAGLGSTPLLYQQYRPAWAGQEAELVFQLHNTPIQIWAELGLLGVVALIGAIALFLYFVYRCLAQPLASSDALWEPLLLGGLLAYGVMSLTDYQLDNVAISGFLVIVVAVLAAMRRNPSPGSDRTAVEKLLAGNRASAPVALAGVGLILAMLLWLIPVHRAWQLSSQGFLALNQQEPNLEFFARSLERAHTLAPWEPYYPYQLGWNLGDRALAANAPEEQKALAEQSINWLQVGNRISPYQEFGHSNLGWLLLSQDPTAAVPEFVRSAQLVPAKRGVFYGLGLSFFAQGNLERAAEAISLEVLRNPLFITSPIWNEATLQPLYLQVIPVVEQRYAELLQQTTDDELVQYLHQSRGGIRWWRGDFVAAHEDWDQYGDDSSQIILALSEGRDVRNQLAQVPESSLKKVIQAWLEPTQRETLLNQAWIEATGIPPIPSIQQILLTGIQNAPTFDHWLKQYAPVQQYRRERAGFGVLNRHIDGPIPSDFWLVSENVVAAQLLPSLIFSPKYLATLDRELQPWRDQFLSLLSSD